MLFVCCWNVWGFLCELKQKCLSFFEDMHTNGSLALFSALYSALLSALYADNLMFSVRNLALQTIEGETLSYLIPCMFQVEQVRF